MKKLTLFISCIMFINFSYANDSDYYKAMMDNIQKLEQAEEAEEYLQLINSFGRISSMNQQEWLPLYYEAYCYIMVNYMEKSKDKRDLYLDKAEELRNQALEINGNENDVELILLQAYIVQSKSNVNPAQRAVELQPVAEKLLDKANKLDPDNPRYYFLTGQNIFYTPKMFGGGKAKAKPLLMTAMEKYESYQLESDLHPNWDQKTTKYLLEKCK